MASGLALLAGWLFSGAAVPAATVGPSGGRVPSLLFAVVGDSRPAVPDDTAHYPSAVLTEIFKDIEALSPRPQFVIGTGDYVYSDAAKPLAVSQAPVQVDRYLEAANVYGGQLFPAMGNHDCGNRVSSNCCPGCHDGATANYTAFLGMLGRLGFTGQRPYYLARFAGSDRTNPWTAKVVVVAANAWNEEQAAWLEQTLAEPTRYTFVVRHEPDYVNGACLGCGASDAIVKRHPYTLLFTGHDHTFRILRSSKEIVVGVGGAPLYDPRDKYGYVVCAQRPDGNIACQERDAGSSSSSYPDSSVVVTPEGLVAR